MRKIGFLLTMVIMLNALHAQDQSWQIEVVTEAGAKPEIRIDSEARPHMAYMIEDFQGRVFHALKEGAEWVIDTVAAGYFYAPWTWSSTMTRAATTGSSRSMS